MKRLAVFSSGRQDWGILKPILASIADATMVHQYLVIGGGHHRELRELDGYQVHAIVEAQVEGDNPLSVARCAGHTTIEIAQFLEENTADCILLVGDRSETLAAALAAVCLRIPIVHIHGGETTLGAIDDRCRHAISQLSSLHCVSHEKHAQCLTEMGVEPQSVHVTGAPGLDALYAMRGVDRLVLFQELGLPDDSHRVLILTYHPVTLSCRDPVDEIGQVCRAVDSQLDERDVVVVTSPNHDAGGQRIKDFLRQFMQSRPRWFIYDNLGQERFHRLMSWSSVMIGNSSAGLIEAPALALPAINIGERQAGRTRVSGVIDVPCQESVISSALHRVLERASINQRQPVECEFGDGNAGSRIASAIFRFMGVGECHQMQQ